MEMSPAPSAASPSVSVASSDASHDLAVTALLSHVLETPGLMSACMAYQDGMKTLFYEDGDVAAGLGHLSLLRLRRALCRKGNEGGGGSGCSTNTCTTTSTSDAQECISSTDRRGACCESGSMDDEDEDGEEGGAEKGEEMLLLEDLRFSHRAADWAAAQGHLEVVRWLLENRDEGCTESAVDGACWNGHEAMVRWLMCEWRQAGSERALDYAASTGRLELVEWLSRRRGSTCTVAAMDGAAGGGHLAVVCWMAANRREGCSQAAFDMAAAGGHLDVIKWLDGAGFLRCSSAGVDNAAGGNHLHVLKWMLEQKPEQQCSSNAYGLAASRGHLEVLKWLHVSMPSLRCPSWAAETAAAAGHLEVVRWLHASGLCLASLASLDEVAGQGQLRALCWLSERGAKASAAAVDWAAEAGYSAVVEYLLKNRHEGCSSEALVGAARRGHLNIVKLLRELRPEQCECVLAARAAAAAAGHVEVVRWLDEIDPELLRALQEAVVSECSIDGSRSSSSSSSSSSVDDDGDENSETPWETQSIPRQSENYSASGCSEARASEGSIDGSCSASSGDGGGGSGSRQVLCDDECRFFSACSSSEIFSGGDRSSTGGDGGNRKGGHGSSNEDGECWMKTNLVGRDSAREMDHRRRHGCRYPADDGQSEKEGDGGYGRRGGARSTSIGVQRYPGFILDNHVGDVSALRGSTIPSDVRIGSTIVPPSPPERRTKGNTRGGVAASEVSFTCRSPQEGGRSRKEHIVDEDINDVCVCGGESCDAAVDYRFVSKFGGPQRILPAPTALLNRRQIEGTRLDDVRLSHEKIAADPFMHTPATPREVPIVLLSAGVAVICVVFVAGWSLWLYTAAVG